MKGVIGKSGLELTSFVKRRKIMSQSKVISATTIIIFIFTIAMVNCALAGEKIKYKSHGAIFTDKWEQTEVGDEKGHVLAVSHSKQIYFNEITGEKHVSATVNTIDINFKTGQGSAQGYGISTYKNGDKTIRTHKGKSVGKGHWKGTFTYVKGTGKFEGITGGGTWDSYSLNKTQSYMEVEGEYQLP
jgi:hypothetical protein